MMNLAVLPHLTQRHLPSDRELLKEFAQTRCPKAFRSLVQRYAPLVWSICRRLIPNRSTAEDAFQATFVAFLKKTSTLHVQSSLSSWFYTVTTRICQRISVKEQKWQQVDLIESTSPAQDKPLLQGQCRDLVGVSEGDAGLAASSRALHLELFPTYGQPE